MSCISGPEWKVVAKPVMAFSAMSSSSSPLSGWHFIRLLLVNSTHTAKSVKFQLCNLQLARFTCPPFLPSQPVCARAGTRTRRGHFAAPQPPSLPTPKSQPPSPPPPDVLPVRTLDHARLSHPIPTTTHRPETHLIDVSRLTLIARPVCPITALAMPAAL
jgi:hypothetical protein